MSVKAKTPSKSSRTALIRDEHILGQPNDLIKLFYVFNEFIDHLSKEGQNLRKLIISKIQEMFDDSGEEATELCFDIAIDYGFICQQTDTTSGQIRFL